MQLKTLLITSASVAVSQAASFTNVGYDVRAGTQFNLTLTDLTGTGTLTLKYGNALDLQTAEVLTSSLTESYYLYTPPASLGAGIAYAFEIQDASGVNYSPQFQVSQATGTISASASSTSSSASSSGTPSASASVTGSATNSSSTGVPTFAATASGTSMCSCALLDRNVEANAECRHDGNCYVDYYFDLDFHTLFYCDLVQDR